MRRDHFGAMILFWGSGPPAHYKNNISISGVNLAGRIPEDMVWAAKPGAGEYWKTDILPLHARWMPRRSLPPIARW